MAQAVYHHHIGTFETTSELPKLDGPTAAILYDTYFEDAEQMDAEFFDGKPFLVGALTKARDTAKGSGNDLSLETYYSPDEIEKLKELTAKIDDNSQKARISTWIDYINFTKTPELLERQQIENLEKNHELVGKMDGFLSELASVSS